MSIGDICNREVVFCRKAETSREAAELMRQHHVGCLVVVDESREHPRPLGVITDRDLVVEIMAERVSPETVSVGDVMSYDLATAREDEGIWEVIRRMRAKGVRRLPIVDEAGALVGIVTMDDMLEFLTDEFYGLVKLLARQREREQETRARP
jgi:CBS domain-containing protein